MPFFRKKSPSKELEDIHEEIDKGLSKYLAKKTKTPQAEIYFGDLDSKHRNNKPVTKADICLALKNELEREKSSVKLSDNKHKNDDILYNYYKNTERLLAEATQRINESEKNKNIFQGKSTLPKFLKKMMSKCQKQTNPMQKEKDLKLQTEMKIYKVVIPFKSAEKNLSSSKIDSKKSSTASKVAGFAAMGVGIATLDIDLINLSTEAFSDDSGNPYSRYTYKADIPKEWVAGHMEKKATKTDLGESPFQLKESEDYRRVHGREFYVVDTHPDAH